jgi:hypothetical protein
MDPALACWANFSRASGTARARIVNSKELQVFRMTDTRKGWHKSQRYMGEEKETGATAI